MASTPTLHTFDPLIVGKIGLYIDPPPSADMVIWLASKTQGGTKTQVGVTNVNATIGLDGLAFIVDAGAAGSVTYWQAKLHDSTGYGSPSIEIAATASVGPPAPPPPPTQQQQLSAMLGATVNVGDVVDFTVNPQVRRTVQPDGSLA